VSLKLKSELIARGYDVYMIRESNDVSLSNKKRALMAKIRTDFYVRRLII